MNKTFFLNNHEIVSSRPKVTPLPTLNMRKLYLFLIFHNQTTFVELLGEE